MSKFVGTGAALPAVPKQPLTVAPPSSPSTARTESTGQTVARLHALLSRISPDIDRDTWLRVLTAIHHETDGGEDGLELAVVWSSNGSAQRDRSAIEVEWRSLKTDPTNLTTIANLDKTLAEIASEHPVEQGKAGTNPLTKYSLRDRLPEIERSAVTAIAILGALVPAGQFTIVFAAANTGKTLLVFFLLIEAIQQRRVDPSKVHYIDMDDNSSGLLEKLRIANELRFHILAEGYQGFSVNRFIREITEMTEKDQARGVIIILDTYKQFANVMDKVASSKFNRLIKHFVMKGGTAIALAHTNKNPGPDGRPVHGGTSDLLDDADCAYILRTISSQPGEKVVEFENTKRRGNVVERAAYRYCTGNEISYGEILASVQLVDETQLVPLKQAEAVRSDADVIDAIEACIKDGINTKMKLAHAVAERAGVSKRAAIQIIERYTGTDPESHRWNFAVRDRGAKVFVLPDSAPSTPSLEIKKV